jgi:hypothetical protein
VLKFISKAFLLKNPGFAYAPFSAALMLANAPSWLMTAVNLVAVIALFTTMLVIGRLGIQSVQESAKNGILHPKFERWTFGSVVLGIIALLTVVFYGKIEAIVNSSALFNALFTILICISAVKLVPKKHKILPVLVGAVILITYIPNILTSGIELWIVTVIYLAIGGLLYGFRRRLA